MSRAAEMGHVGFSEWDRLEGPSIIIREWEKPPGSPSPTFDPTPPYREETPRSKGNTRRSHPNGKGGAEILAQVCCFHQMVLLCLTLWDFPTRERAPWPGALLPRGSLTSILNCHLRAYCKHDPLIGHCYDSLLEKTSFSTQGKP